MTGIEAVQPLSQRVAVQIVAHPPIYLCELVRLKQGPQLGVQYQNILARFLVTVDLINQTARIAVPPLLYLDSIGLETYQPLVQRVTVRPGVGFFPIASTGGKL
jgi:hypothetical protein